METRIKVENKQQLRVFWIPQVPMTPFYVKVDSVKEGVKIMDVLAKYDMFQYATKVKPDYCNAGGLQMWDKEQNEWVDLYDEETDDYDPIEWLKNKEMDWLNNL